MRHFHVKSIILGIGIGIILTSIVSMIYLAGNMPKPTRDEIIKRAKEYGLVEKTSLLQEQNEQVELEQDVKISDTGTPDVGGEATKYSGAMAAKEQGTEAINDKNSSAPQVLDQDMEVIIVSGDTSEKVAVKLKSAGLISNVDDFLKALAEMNLESKIKIGEFKIKKGTDIENIIKTIT